MALPLIAFTALSLRESYMMLRRRCDELQHLFEQCPGGCDYDPIRGFLMRKLMGSSKSHAETGDAEGRFKRRRRVAECAQCTWRAARGLLPETHNRILPRWVLRHESRRCRQSHGLCGHDRGVSCLLEIPRQ